MSDVEFSKNEERDAKLLVIESKIEQRLRRIGGILTNERKDRLCDMSPAELIQLASRLEMVPTVPSALLLIASAIQESTQKHAND